MLVVLTVCGDVNNVSLSYDSWRWLGCAYVAVVGSSSNTFELRPYVDVDSVFLRMLFCGPPIEY